MRIGMDEQTSMPTLPPRLLELLDFAFPFSLVIDVVIDSSMIEASINVPCTVDGRCSSMVNQLHSMQEVRY